MLQRDPSLQSWQESINETTGGKVGLAEKGTLQKPSPRKLGTIRQDRVERREPLQKQEAITEVDSSEDETDEGSEDSQDGKRLDKPSFSRDHHISDPFSEDNKQSSKLESKDSIEDDAFLPEEPKADSVQKEANQQQSKDEAMAQLTGMDELQSEVCARPLSGEKPGDCETVQQISESGTAAELLQGNIVKPLSQNSTSFEDAKDTLISQTSIDCPEQMKCLPVGLLQLGQGDYSGLEISRDNLKESASRETTYLLSQDPKPSLVLSSSCTASISSLLLVRPMDCKDMHQKKELQSTKKSISLQNLANIGKVCAQKSPNGELQRLSAPEAISKHGCPTGGANLSLSCPISSPILTPAAIAAAEDGKEVWPAHLATGAKDMRDPVNFNMYGLGDLEKTREEVPQEGLCCSQENMSKQDIQETLKESPPGTAKAFTTGNLIKICSTCTEAKSPAVSWKPEYPVGPKEKAGLDHFNVLQVLEGGCRESPPEDQLHGTTRKSRMVSSGPDCSLSSKKENPVVAGKSGETGDQSQTRDLLLSESDVKKT